MGRAQATWQDATPQSPCPVCGHGDFCTLARDGRTVICRREAYWGSRAGRHTVDELGDRWTYSIGGRGDGGGGGHDRSRESTPAGAMGAPAAGTVACASEVDRDRVYRCLLGALHLSPDHRADLRRRGLVDAEIDRRGYRTLSRGRAQVARTVIEQCGHGTADLIASVPGFYLQTDAAAKAGAQGGTWWSLAGQSGLLIPVRDVQGRILAFKIRIDKDDDAGGRYRTLSSTAHGGPGPGGLVHVPLQALQVQQVDAVRITEGELKADVTTALDPEGLLTLSVPGVGAWRSAVEVLRSLKTKVVRLAMDRDGWTNWRVAGAIERAAETLIAEGYELEMETWG